VEQHLLLSPAAKWHWAGKMAYVKRRPLSPLADSLGLGFRIKIRVRVSGGYHQLPVGLAVFLHTSLRCKNEIAKM